MVASNDMVSFRMAWASLGIDVVSGQSSITSAFASNPMKLLAPRPRGPSVWAYTSSFGGGLVAGDETRLKLRLGFGARCFLGTQASTKIYRNPNLLPCGHQTRATLEPGSFLLFAPDPVQAFAGSTYRQRQAFHLAPDATLVLVDWFTSGRAARGERWAFNRLTSRNEIHIRPGQSMETSIEEGADNPAHSDHTLSEGELVFLDSIRLDTREGDVASRHQTGRFNCFGMLLFIGPLAAESAARLLEEISARPVPSRSACVSSASPIRDGAILRIAGEEVEAVERELRRHLRPLSALLGDDPWSRKR